LIDCDHTKLPGKYSNKCARDASLMERAFRFSIAVELCVTAPLRQKP
jgi:hypothetical protein